jgi:gamma-glutamylaminecyclotransferase
MKLFVYGTLLSGERNHHRLQSARLLGVCRTEPGYTLVSLGPYPALREGGTTSVTGEVYDVADGIVPAIDRFEGHPHLYRRKIIRLVDGADVNAYVLSPGHGEEREILESGDWRREVDRTRRGKARPRPRSRDGAR